MKNMKKEITLPQVGYRITGTSFLSLWGGGKGSIEMDSCFIPIDKLSKTTLLGCINDNGFGVESIDGAIMEIYDVYGHRNGFEVYNREIEIDENQATKYHKCFCKQNR